ncbi:MAG: glycosyltransferase family 1 protein [Desulfobacteraceae bacterium]|nr:MAG: glycosyltransferase family 1 protein [Desulfobacteraceae bacterium]
MNICILTGDFPPIRGGIANYIQGVYTGFKSLGHECRVLFLPANEPAKIENPDVRLVPIGGNHRITRVFSAWRAIRSQKKVIRNSDLVLVSAWSPLGTAYRLCFESEKPHSILLSYGNDVYEPLRSARLKKKMRKTFDYFDGLAAISQYTARLCEKVTGKQIQIIGGGLDRRFLQILDKTSLRVQDKPLTFLSVGRLIERKGCGPVLDCLAQIRRHLPAWRYWIIGQGAYEPELRRKIADYGLAENVEILTRVSFDELLWRYEAADLFIMISREIPEQGEVEGLGLVYMEAGAAYLPVLAGRTGGVVDVVFHRQNGLLVDPLSNDEISENILELSRNESLRTQLGRNGRKLAEEEWRWETVALKIMAAAERKGEETKC